MLMNSFWGKQILALIREGNYAHPGEEEAIELMFATIPSNPDRKMLDVGCGRGGTAHYLQSHGWGNVTGLDLDADSIQYAQEHYPGCKFFTANVLNAPNTLPTTYDLLYLFNSFYAFEDQAQALDALHQVAHPGSTLLIFDYIDLGTYHQAPITQANKPFIPHPIVLAEITSLLGTQWQLTRIQDLSAQYQQWYQHFMAQAHSKRLDIIELAGVQAWETVSQVYGELLESIRRGELGGAIITTQAQ
ncbi:class I SAM-dependent methyltransferase [Thermosynechococcaceae cyanobacterium BACA0444]|uniref:Class I SAM-dependent methyltransferase n=1 Tax=Pseudocalidococcus azoricus BACA0444 TaxID=2918990 RepID=A0AAE4JXK4_9CYAN|nr:class I SAM-dependent methyltransferase [Pseudocalidococcus azoricus]MDS3861163.1 class I SAM-dependent methyltransferase [Pseudocalidococcus azoricus BACA0444]